MKHRDRLEGGLTATEPPAASPPACQPADLALLSVLERRARELGYARIWLETRKVNEVATRFYLRHGYRVIPNFGKYAGNEAAVCFEKAVR